MCGLSGIVSRDQSVSTENFIISHATLAHRGPDGNGIRYIAPGLQVNCSLTLDSKGFLWNENLNDLPNAKVLLGHHRLSILDLSVNGYQPMQYKKWTILFNGEIYNYLEIRAELISLGYIFKTETDTEVLLKAWAEWGEIGISKLNGMWAFCIYDEYEDKMYFSRDRFGEKPLYWSIHHQTLYFASELKFFKGLIPFSVNQTCANEFLLRNKIDHTDQTMFSGIYQIKPGVLLTIDLKNFKHREFRYWNLPDCKVNTKRNFEDTCNEFLELLKSSIKIKLRSDVPYGLMLSGGLDSGAIAGILNDMDNTSIVRSYSAVFSDKKFSEKDNIELILSRNKNLESKFISYDSEEALEKLPQLIWSQDHPVRSLASFSQYKIYQSIKLDSKVGVVLGGQGADELFAGYSKYNHLYLNTLLLKVKLYDFVLEWNALRQKNCLSSYEIMRNLAFSISSILRFGNFKQVVSNGLTLWQTEQLLNSALPEYLRYEDRNSMAASIESRLPFLDYRLVEFAMTLPDSFKVEKGIRKRVMRSALINTVPNEVVNDRVKKGFISPQLEWQQIDPMKKWLKNNFEVPQFSMNNSMKLLKDPWFKWRVACFNQWCSVFDL